jgi:protein-glutamine gamma-glutamyltransferase
VPARVANGYRLGPWIEEGGYFLVTQAEAHSWVEYYDADAGGWRTADPTPLGPPAPFGAGAFLASLDRWADTVRFSWDRHVVRFSDEDQLAGAGWAVNRLEALTRWRPGRAAKVLAVLALLGGLGWFGRRLPRRARGGPGRIRELRPLLRKARHALPPREAETARAWLGRLAALRPQRAAQLERLARAADAAAYGRQPAGTLKALAREEARHWDA